MVRNVVFIYATTAFLRYNSKNEENAIFWKKSLENFFYKIKNGHF
jgi:hypothetical protein